MEKAVIITLTVINCVVAAVVLTLILTDRKSEEATRTCDITYNGTDVDVHCIGLRLSTVPKSLPANATEILLTENCLSQITNTSFGCLEKLRTLDLQYNDIAYIEEGSFQCLPMLSVLDLSYNSLNFSYESFPIGLFSNLKYLKNLEIVQRSSIGGYYPDRTFMDLTHLESLALSPILHFGISFTKMIHLKELTLAFVSSGQIRNDTFASFKHHDIRALQIFHVEDSRIDNMAFKYFPRLQTIILNDLKCYLRQILECLNVFVGKNMSVIKFEGQCYFFDFDDHRMCYSALTPDDTKDLVTICVEKVYLRYFGIRYIQSGTFSQEPFSKCVKYLDLSANCIVANKAMYMELQDLHNLEYLNMAMITCIKTFDLKSGNDYRSDKSYISELSTSSDGSDDAWNEALQVLCHGEVLHISVPKKLKTLILPHLFHNILLNECTVTVEGAENLVHLKIPNWKLHTIDSRLLGVTNLISVDYTGNFGLIPEEFLFSSSQNINSLILADNMGLNFSSIFFSLRKLKYLSVSNSGITDFPFKPEEMSILSAIDLSDNKMTTLSSDVRDGLDQIVSDGHSLSLNLKGNLFNCACNSFSFATWMIETDVRFTDWEYYKCINEDGEEMNMPVSATSFLKHWRKCYSRFWLSFTVSVSFLFITVLVIGIMLDKYSLHLKCILRKWFGVRLQVPKREAFLYDIFVYYSSKDDHTWVCNTFRQKMEEERGLRLCIPDRDFIPGSRIAEEILEAIHKSWKTVVFMTEVFLEDELCSFTLSSAVYASTNDMPKRLIILYSNEIFNKPLPRIVTQLLDGDDNFILEELEELEQWDILYRKTLCWV